MEPGTSLSEQLRAVFEAIDEEKQGSVRVERFADLAKEHFGTESDEVRGSCFVLVVVSKMFWCLSRSGLDKGYRV